MWPVENGASVNVTANENVAFWFTVSVPKDAPAGDYTTTVQIAGSSFPVQLHVFNFAIPDELHVKSQMNFNHQAVLDKYGVGGIGTEYWMYVNKMKQFFIDHRLTPKSALWSAGLTGSSAYPYEPYVSYNTTTNVITADPTSIWGFEWSADRYINGNGFNGGTGFPSFMGMTFVSNDASVDPRPANFYGIALQGTDWLQNPNSTYNTEWKEYMAAVQTYLTNKGYIDKAYYYMANEPQDEADYNAVAWYANLIKSAAPNLKLMVSEEPKPEIYNNPTHGPCKIDIWLPVLNNYDPAVSHDREKNHNEETWIYFLHGTRPPYYNPITLDHPGIESLFTGWLLWKYRIRGIAYYSMNNWSKNPWTDPMTDDHNGDLFMLYPPSKTNTNIVYGATNHRFVSSIRFELMRDSLETYEYLYVLSGNKRPEVDQVNDADKLADKIIYSTTSYNRDSEFMYNLRRFIGLKNGNEISEIPDIQPKPKHPRAQGEPGNYYINFQDPAGNPTANPLIVDGKEHIKIGWNNYDESLGYGWYGNPDHVEYQYGTGPNELQKSIIYDNWGREHSFEFDLPNGIYNVTVSVGHPSNTYSHNKIKIEGVDFVNDEETNPGSPYIVRTKQVQVKDYKLTMEMGISMNIRCSIIFI